MASHCAVRVPRNSPSTHAHRFASVLPPLPRLRLPPRRGRRGTCIVGLATQMNGLSAGGGAREILGSTSSWAARSGLVFAGTLLGGRRIWGPLSFFPLPLLSLSLGLNLSLSLQAPLDAILRQPREIPTGTPAASRFAIDRERRGERACFHPGGGSWSASSPSRRSPTRTGPSRRRGPRPSLALAVVDPVEYNAMLKQKLEKDLVAVAMWRVRQLALNTPGAPLAR